jgi:DNA-binding NarL/FixJ family response regulator
MARTVLLAGSDPLFSEVAAHLLEARADLRAIGSVQDGVQALMAVGRLRPDCVLVLGDLARLGPAGLARQIRQRAPEVVVVVVGGKGTPLAHSLPADASTDAILEALAAPPKVTVPDTRPPNRLAQMRSLTPRERETLQLLARGLSKEQIAERLGLSTGTVRTHMQNLYAKLGLHSRLDLVHFAARHGLVTDDHRRPDAGS